MERAKEICAIAVATNADALIILIKGGREMKNKIEFTMIYEYEDREYTSFSLFDEGTKIDDMIYTCCKFLEVFYHCHREDIVITEIRIKKRAF